MVGEIYEFSLIYSKCGRFIIWTEEVMLGLDDEFTVAGKYLHLYFFLYSFRFQ